MRAHLIGVAGAGMAPLAGLLRAAGVDVSGSDVAFDPPMGPRLAAWGVQTMEGLDPSHLDGLDPSRDVVVVGNVCRKDNVLAVAAEARGLRRISLPTALRELVFKDRPVIAVAGTHGKTTTTALLAAILEGAGLEPGFLIGGIPTVPIGGNGRDEASPFALGRVTRTLGTPPIDTSDGRAKPPPPPRAPFVIEGDEYDSAFFEKVPKMWGYAPRAAILTSIEHDHVDIYPDEGSYRAAFVGLLERLPSEEEGGLLVANAGDPAVVSLVESAKPRCRVVWYAGSDSAGRLFPSGASSVSSGSVTPTWTAHEVGLLGDDDPVQPFDLFVGPTSAGRFGAGIFGVHNISNVVAALALAAEMFGVRVRDAAGKLGTFRGTQRRQERLLPRRSAASRRDVFLYDDFAHHPTAVDATLRSIRPRHRGRKLVAVYEPRSATACRAMHQEAYATAFDAADVVILAPLGRSTIPAAERLDLEELGAALEVRKKKVILATSHDDVVERTRTAALDGEDGAVVVVMSNGAFGGVTARLREHLA